LHQAKNQLDAAAASFERAIQDDPKSHLGYNNLAWLVVQRKGDLAQALKWAQRAVELSPRNSNYEDTLAQVHLARGELDLAMAASRRAVASAPGVPDYHYTLGLIQEAKGQPALALSSYDAALKIGKPFSAKSDAIARRDGLSSRKTKP
jgi:tetratricopeptide (TPR) repeat protein